MWHRWAAFSVPFHTGWRCACLEGPSVQMSGLVYSSCFKLKQVTAPGQDVLGRGWTRGGEIYLWVPRGVKVRWTDALPWLPVAPKYAF